MNAEQRDFLNAIENYTKVIKLSSNSDYTKVIEKGPKDARHYNNRGIAHRRLGNMAQAKADYAKAQELEVKQ